MSACGGGTPSSPQTTTTSSAQGSVEANGAHVQLSITLPGTAPAATSRKAAYVSPGAAGLSVSVYLSSDTAHANPVAVSTAAIATGAPGCISGPPISCVIPIAVPPSPADDFVGTVYNAVPVNGAFPSSAQVLGVGSATGTAITANAQNTVALNVLGVPFSAGLAFSQSGNPTIGQAAVFPLRVTVLDASSQSIQGTYATPLQLTSTNPSITSFIVNGSPGTTIKASTDTVTLSYGGGAGTSTLSLTGTAPFTATGLSFSPSYVPPVATPNSLNLVLNSKLSGTFTVSEPSYSGAYSESSTCGTNATVTPAAATGPTAIFTVMAGLVPSFASCTITVQDNIGQSVSVSITVTNDT